MTASSGSHFQATGFAGGKVTNGKILLPFFDYEIHTISVVTIIQ
jgi:hypothetical protein